MRPPPGSKTFEKVACGDFIFGTIEKVEYDMEHKFTFKKGEDTIKPAVRISFKLDNYEYPHRTHWMTFSLDERSNLYAKYVAKLVANAHPYIDFDLDCLIGMQVKTVWSEKNDFQNLDLIAPAKQKLTVKENEANEPPIPDDDSDFIPEIDDSDVPL
jgi:hypothetical protein